MLIALEDTFDHRKEETLRKRSVMLTSVGVGVLMLTLAAPAAAVDTPVTFEVTAGTLTITVPVGPVDLGSTTPGRHNTTSLGEVAVSDTRGDVTSNWTASAYASNFTDGALEIPPGAISYWSGAATATTGGPTFTPDSPIRRPGPPDCVRHPYHGLLPRRGHRRKHGDLEPTWCSGSPSRLRWATTPDGGHSVA